MSMYWKSFLYWIHWKQDKDESLRERGWWINTREFFRQLKSGYLNFPLIRGYRFHIGRSQYAWFYIGLMRRAY